MKNMLCSQIEFYATKSYTKSYIQGSFKKVLSLSSREETEFCCGNIVSLFIKLEKLIQNFVLISMQFNFYHMFESPLELLFDSKNLFAKPTHVNIRNRSWE